MANEAELANKKADYGVIDLLDDVGYAWLLAAYTLDGETPGSSLKNTLAKLGVIKEDMSPERIDEVAANTAQYINDYGIDDQMRADDVYGETYRDLVRGSEDRKQVIFDQARNMCKTDGLASQNLIVSAGCTAVTDYIFDTQNTPAADTGNEQFVVPGSAGR